MNIMRGVSRALGGSKAVRMQLCVNVDSVTIPNTTNNVSIELERGKNKLQAEASFDEDKNEFFLPDAFNVPLTLFRDPKKGFKTKFFTLRVKTTTDKKIIADMGQLDIANIAKVEGTSNLKLKGSNNVLMGIRVECIFIEEAGDGDDCSTMMEGTQDQDLDGFEDLPSVVREELSAGNYTSDNGEAIFADSAAPGSPSSIPRKTSPRKDRTSSTSSSSSSRPGRSKQSASPYRNLGAVEELARQLRVAKGERDDALQKLGEAQKLNKGDDTAAALQAVTRRAEAAESALSEIKNRNHEMEVELKDLKRTNESMQQSVASKDKEIAQYITDFNTLKGKSIAQESEGAARLAALEARLKEASHQTQASSDETAKSSEAKVRSLQEVADSLREQLELTRRAHSEAKSDIAALTLERNELKEALKTAEVVTKEAVSRASIAETTVSKLEEEVAQMEMEREEESEMADTREGAMRATAQFRIKELEEGMSALNADHEQALSRAQELEKLVESLKAEGGSSKAIKVNYATIMCAQNFYFF
jgi:hypothetical protein